LAVKIPYELIVTSASRPHLLQPTLESLLTNIDQMPERILIHDDAVFPNKWSAVQDAVIEAVKDLTGHSSISITRGDPPRRLGLAINWLMTNVQTEYVLYSQDDFVTVRPVPIARALDVMHQNNLHHIRFNKRATMQFKETWNGRWHKEERTFGDATLTVSDHWYFQLGLWRVAEMRKALAFWTANDDRTRRLCLDEPENMINHFFDKIEYPCDDSTGVDYRVNGPRTFIWGPIGEDRFIRHIGGNKADWVGDHVRIGGIDNIEVAWREIDSYRKKE
jgi:hypothetical protein